jgi:hypothetical protein
LAADFLAASFLPAFLRAGFLAADFLAVNADVRDFVRVGLDLVRGSVSF